MTALHRVSYRGYIDIAIILIQNGASVDELDKYGCVFIKREGKTPIYYAITYGKADVVKLLIYSGAEFEACS